MTMPAAPSPVIAVPGRGRYLLGIAIFLAGMAAMGIFLTSRLADMQEGLTRFLVPGETVLTLAAGEYTIFHEPNSVIDGTAYVSTGLDGLNVAVSGPDGEIAPLTTASSGRYNFPGHSGYSLFDFSAPVAGDYTVTAAYPGADDGPKTVLAVGAGFMSSLLTTIFSAIAIAFAGAIIAAILIITTLMKRRRAGLRL